jgi:hypothetical protein
MAMPLSDEQPDYVVSDIETILDFARRAPVGSRVMSKSNAARVARIVAAGEALYGERWQSAMVRSIGISKQLMSFIISGDRQVTDDVEDKVIEALSGEIERLGKTADKLMEIQGRILAASEK